MKRLLVAICGFPLAFGGQLPTAEPRESVDPEVALEESALRGDNAVAQARQALANGDSNAPLLRSRLGHAYFAQNRDEDALGEYLWCLDHLEKRDSPQYATETSRVLANLILLAQRHEPAMEALVKRRSAAETRLRSGSPEPSDAVFVTGVNLGLDDEAATVALYQDVRGGKLRHLDLATLRREVLRILVKILPAAKTSVSSIRLPGCSPVSSVATRRSLLPKRGSTRRRPPSSESGCRPASSTAANPPRVNLRARSWCYDAPLWGI